MPNHPTRLQLERAALLARGMSHQQIAEHECVSVNTVKGTFKHLREALAVRSGSSYATHLLMVIELVRRKLLVWDGNREHLEVNDVLYRSPD